MPSTGPECRTNYASIDGGSRGRRCRPHGGERARHDVHHLDADPGRNRDGNVRAHHRIGGSVSVAVRSSGISGDSGASSFAGRNATLTNVTGDDDVLARITDYWASLAGARRIRARRSEGVERERL